MASTFSCFEGDEVGGFGEVASGAAAFVAVVDFELGAATLLAGRFALREIFRLGFERLDLAVGIWLSFGINDSIMCWHRHDPAD
jgi:hypothetical protein